MMVTNNLVSLTVIIEPNFKPLFNVFIDTPFLCLEVESILIEPSCG